VGVVVQLLPGFNMARLILLGLAWSVNRAPCMRVVEEVKMEFSNKFEIAEHLTYGEVDLIAGNQEQG
jgi:hypothetical protein